MTDNVINIQPRSLHTTMHGCMCNVVKDPVTGKWRWSVTKQLDPQTFQGDADTYSDAKQEVDKIVATLR